MDDQSMYVCPFLGTADQEKSLEEEETNCCCSCLRVCIVCCYLSCPPCPDDVVRKLAFHPTKRGESYRIFHKNEPHKMIEKVLDVEDGKIGIKLEKFRMAEFITTVDLEVAVSNVSAYLVTTKRKNRLVMVRYKPSNVTVTDQVLLFSQMNSSDLGQLLNPEVAILQRLGEHVGAEVFSYDYSGYGYSTGVPREKNVYCDIEAIYNKIRERWPNKKIVLVGCSLGTAASVHLASKCPSGVSGVVLIAGFTSGLPVLRKEQPTADTCCLDRFCSVKRIGDIEAPVLLIHGMNDLMVPVTHAKMLHSMAKKTVKPLYLEGVVHNSVLSHPAVYRRIKNFVVSDVNDTQESSSN